VRIVQAGPEDLGVYVAILEEIAEWLASRQLSHVKPGTYRTAEAYLLDSIRTGEVHLACLGQERVGTLRLLLSDAVVWPEITSEDAVYLYNLTVRRKWARQGLGCRMLEWVESRSREMGRPRVRLDCFADNPFLERYYLDAGYRDRGTVEAYYPAPFGVFRLRRFEKLVG
jgi:ribosomal protein S18 acetylase RimI-like enzyme